MPQRAGMRKLPRAPTVRDAPYFRRKAANPALPTSDSEQSARHIAGTGGFSGLHPASLAAIVKNCRTFLAEDFSMSVPRTPPFAPDFSKGLLPAVAQDHRSGDVLMLAYMNEEAWQKTLQTGEVHYWSRSRNQLWHKGATSGNVQKVRSVRLDCDSDAILLLVEQEGGAACHTGRRSCFYREWKDGSPRECSPRVFDPKDVYGG